MQNVYVCFCRERERETCIITLAKETETESGRESEGDRDGKARGLRFIDLFNHRHPRDKTQGLFEAGAAWLSIRVPWILWVGKQRGHASKDPRCARLASFSSFDSHALHFLNFIPNA